MAEQTEEKKVLPACPVETTLSLIGDKWRKRTASSAVKFTRKSRPGWNIP